MLASGIADLILAALIIMGLPSTAGWVLGVIVGINLITSGWAAIMMAIAGRSVVKTLASATRRRHVSKSPPSIFLRRDGRGRPFSRISTVRFTA